MANKVLVKRSAVAAKVPLTTDLSLGELAINTYDGKIYIKKDDGTPVVIEVGGIYVTTAALSTTTADQIIYTFPVAAFNSAKYLCQVTWSTSIHLTEISVMHDGTNVYITEYGTMYSGSSLGTFTADLSAGLIRLKFSPVNTTTTVVISTSNSSVQIGSSAGTVTSVGFTGGLISVATPTSTPALTVAGTSGGIPYFSSGTTWATSAALVAGSLVQGGGAGVAPSTITTGTGVVTALGVNTGSAGAFVVNGGALGTPSSGNLSNCTVDGTNSVGYLTVPQNSQSAAYPIVLADNGKHIFHPVGDANARTYTIPANGTIAFPIGSALTFVNMSASDVTIAITTDTMNLAGAGTTGSRTLAQYGIATALKVTSTNWIISGTNLT